MDGDNVLVTEAVDADEAPRTILINDIVGVHPAYDDALFRTDVEKFVEQGCVVDGEATFFHELPERRRQRAVR